MWCPRKLELPPLDLCNVMVVAQTLPGLPSPELALKNSLSGHTLISECRVLFESRIKFYESMEIPVQTRWELLPPVLLKDR